LAGSEKRWTLGDVAALLGGELVGDPNQWVSRPTPADGDDPNGICFAGARRYVELAEASPVGAVLLSAELLPCAKPHILVSDPRSAFGRLLAHWQRPLPLNTGVHALAVVDAEADVHPQAQVGPYAVVERGARIEANARIFPFAYVGENCVVGEGAAILPHAVLYQDVLVGARSVVHSGAVIGADGFGFVWDGDKQIKVPQVGAVEIGADVEIGSNVCIDRATSGVTRIGDGVKLDNLVQVGHNVAIGGHTVIAALTGISGSTTVGERVVMGGSCATSDHIQIADDVRLGGRTGVLSDIDEPGEYWGMPARPLTEAIRASVLVYRLPELLKRVRELERRLAANAPPEDGVETT